MLVDAARILRAGGILILEVGNSVEALEGLSPLLPPLWVELEQGGHGVAVFMWRKIWHNGRHRKRGRNKAFRPKGVEPEEYGRDMSGNTFGKLFTVTTSVSVDLVLAASSTGVHPA